MPLVRFYIEEGRTQKEVKEILDITHEVTVAEFKVPQRDRYQIVTEHKPGHMILEDTGLGFVRDEGKQVLVQVFTSPRDTDAKLAFCENLAKRLEAETGMDTKNLMIAFFENTRADWSFGFGRAQYVTGELG